MSFKDDIVSSEKFTNLSKKVQEKILEYAKPCIGFDSQSSKEPLPNDSSKFGGIPVFTQEGLPRNKNNVPLFMVVQLNFEEIRKQAGQHPDLPESGILQIFIDILDPSYGLVGYNGEPNNYAPQVVRFLKNVPSQDEIDNNTTQEYTNFYNDCCEYYSIEKKLENEGLDYEDIELAQAELPFVKKYSDPSSVNRPYLPVTAECQLSFKGELSLPIEDSIDLPYPEARQLWEDIGEEGKEYIKETICQHRLVGYLKDKRTSDPRHTWGIMEIDHIPEELRPLVDDKGEIIRDDLQIFLELDSDWQKNEKIMTWWDCAQAHFMIKHTDLEKKNFNCMEFSVEA